jgi:glycosyltransferase involved in cell wall biosynthesis
LIEKQGPVLSVIIPCYNEEKNLERGVLEEVHQYLLAQPFSWEVVIVNDDSTDRSRELIGRFIKDTEGFALRDISHGGKPAAVWAGIQKAKGQAVLFTDMDQSTPIGELSKLLPWYEQGFEVVIGSRRTVREGSSLVRKVGSIVFLTLRRLFLLRDIIDTQCGFKLCKRQVALEVFPHLEFLRRQETPIGWKVTAYDVEFLYLVERAGYKTQEVNVAWSNRDQSDTKGQEGDLSRYLNESLQMAKEVVRVKVNQLRGLYSEIEDAQAVGDGTT